MAKKKSSKRAKKALVIPPEQIGQAIIEFRGHRVLVDADLARLYGVETRALIQAVKRNPDRFPDDFMFQLDDEEYERLRSQTVISKPGRGGRRYAPYVFTEHGAVMAANVLNSPRAIEVSVYVVRAFVKLREALATHKDLARKIASLERKYASHDEKFQIVFDAIRQLMAPPVKKSRRIGFGRADDE